MDSEAYTQLRQEYFTGRKRTDDDQKLLKAKDYTPEQQEAIKQARIALKHAMHRCKTAREEWRRLLGTSIAGTAVDVSRVVRKARNERYEARAAVRAADLAYRVAWELPVLLHEKLKFLPFTPGMQIFQLGSAPDFGQALRDYAERDAEATMRLTKPRKRITSLREHLRSE